jgi:signal transduction histidine kinase
LDADQIFSGYGGLREMFGVSRFKWPFVPTCLNDILDKDTLAVIESGSCERLGRPLTILDFDSQTGGFTHRIESVNEKQRYEEFCRFFRNENFVKGGDAACKKRDVEQAKISLQDFQKTGEPYRLFPCHMGLMDMTYIIQIRGRPVALVFSGQFCPPDGSSIHEALQRMGKENNGDINIGEAEKGHLGELASNLTAMPEDARARLEKEALHLQRIAEAEFERRKRQAEQDFLENLRGVANMLSSMDQDQLRYKISQALALIKDFCHCEYALFFTGVQENDTVLTPFAQVGLPASVQSQLPHFNWSKARLPHENFTIDQQNFSGESQKMIGNGLRGDNREYFSNAACFIPTTMGDRYRSVLVLGSFAEKVNIVDERHFIIEIGRIMGLFVRTSLEVLYLEQERRRWKNIAGLLNHEVKTALTTIMTPIGRARSLVQKSGHYDAKRADEFLKKAEDQALLLARITSGTLEGIAIKVEHDDLEFEGYSLSALVENCVNGFLKAAREKNLELVIESSVGALPYADLDVPRITIALANLIENAIKYSFSRSRIFIRSHLNITSGMDQAFAVIEVDDIGFEVREVDLEKIFEIGERGGDTARIKRIPGSGYGLWEARSIVKAHGGEIHVKFHPTEIQKHEGRASRVVFSIEIPLKQRK